MTTTTTNLHLPLATSGRFSLAASLKAGFKLIDTAIKAVQDSIANLAAPSVSYDHTASGLAATNAKTALDELAARKVIPAFTVAEANKVLTVSADGLSLVWTAKS